MAVRGHLRFPADRPGQVVRLRGLSLSFKAAPKQRPRHSTRSPTPKSGQLLSPRQLQAQLKLSGPVTHVECLLSQKKSLRKVLRMPGACTHCFSCNAGEVRAVKRDQLVPSLHCVVPVKFFPLRSCKSSEAKPSQGPCRCAQCSKQRRRVMALPGSLPPKLVEATELWLLERKKISKRGGRLQQHLA